MRSGQAEVRSTPLTASATTSTGGRLRAAWRAAHGAVPGVPRWARLAAHLVPLTVLPSSIWRIAAGTFHAPLGPLPAGSFSSMPPWLPLEAFVALLSVGSELLAFTAVGLIARWGEVVPGWIPGLGGRRVPPAAATVPAALGATVLTVLWTAVLVTFLAGHTIRGEPHPVDVPWHGSDWQVAVFAVAYLPLVLWGPLLAAVTVAYHRRRRGRSVPATD